MRLTKNSLIFYLPSGSRELKLLVFLACAGIFTNVSPNATLTRQKQRVVVFVKKHPIASIMLVGTLWVVYKMIRNYRRTRSLAGTAPEWWISLRGAYKRWKKPRFGEDALQRQAEQAEDRRTPQHSSEASSEDRDMNHRWIEREPSQPNIIIQNIPFQNSLVHPVVAQAQDNRQDHFLDSVMLDRDDDLKVRHFVEAVIQEGNPQGQNELGVQFLNGVGRKQDTVKAFMLFEAAAKHGLSAAQNNLGHCYLNGLGVTRDDSEAFKLFELAARQGNEYAQDHLGFCYLEGWGVRKNLSKALFSFRAAANNGHLNSQILMYHLVRMGIFVPQNDFLADHYFEWIKKQVGSEEVACKKLAENDLYVEFVKSIASKGCVGDKCSICQEAWPAIEQDASVSILPCRHCFCQQCFDEWSEKQGNRGLATTCPLCRRVVQPQKIIIGAVV